MTEIDAPTATEQGYLDQGYQLPDGITWRMVHDVRATRDIAEIYVPVALAAGCAAWGVPYIGGKPLKH